MLGACAIGLVTGAAWLTAVEGPLASGLALGLLGLCAGPVFPALIATTPGRVGPEHGARAVGFQVAAAALGQALVPWALGAIAGAIGIAAVAPAILALAALLVCAFVALASAGGGRSALECSALPAAVRAGLNPRGERT